MATEAQIAANRENAKKSTGPRTAQGKTAASKNAVKHGLFDHRPTIHGEIQADYDLHRERFLAEYEPVGPTESALVARIVSLAWRLRRVGRMETEAIEHLIVGSASNTRFSLIVSMMPEEVRQDLVDSGTLGRDLSLGRAVVTDFTNYKVLDRLMLYERRMETSMLRMIKELKQLQSTREAEQACAVAEQPVRESPPAQRERSDLKKRTQLAAELTLTKSCAREDYDDKQPAVTCESKAERTRFQAPSRACAAGKGEISGVGRASG